MTAEHWIVLTVGLCQAAPPLLVLAWGVVADRRRSARLAAEAAYWNSLLTSVNGSYQKHLYEHDPPPALRCHNRLSETAGDRERPKR